MAKRKKRIELMRWRVHCPKCDALCVAAVERFVRKVAISFECYACGLSGEYEIRGSDAKEFLREK